MNSIPHEAILNELKDSIIKYLLDNHNITWLNDEFEEQIYALISEIIVSYFIKHLRPLDGIDEN